MTRGAPTPRIAPGGRARRRPVHLGVRRGRRAGRRAPTPPNLFLTLGRHRKLFRGWLRFAGAADAGRQAAPPRDRAGDPARRPPARLRVRVRAPRRLGRRAGLADADLARVASTGPTPSGWIDRASARCSPRSTSCTATATSTTPTWAALRDHLDEREAIELCCSPATTRCSRRPSPRCGSSPTSPRPRVADAVRGARAPAPRPPRRSAARRSGRRSGRGSLLAMAEAMAEKGYADTSVADVLKRRRASRGRPSTSSTTPSWTASSHAFDAAGRVLLGRVGDARRRDHRATADRALSSARIGAYLDDARSPSRPSPASSWWRSYAAGAAAIERRAAVQARFVDALVGLLDLRSPDEDAPPPRPSSPSSAPRSRCPWPATTSPPSPPSAPR